MRTTFTNPHKAVPLILLLMAAIQIAALMWYFHFFANNGYLPLPFIYDKSDTFMDLYNSLWWASNDGKYTVWGSVYPPLNFLILRPISAFAYGGLYPETSHEMRDISVWPAIIMIAFHVAAPLAVILSPAWRQFSALQRVLAVIVSVISPPFLFSMERGNLIIICVFFLPMLLSKTPLLRASAVAFLINLKPYFAIMLLVPLLQLNFRSFLVMTCLSGSLFLFTGLADDRNFPIFLTNLVSYSQNDILSSREVLAFPSSISAFSYVINLASKNATATDLPVDIYISVGKSIEFVKILGLLTFFFCFAWAASKLEEGEGLIWMLVPIVNLGIWVGGYSQIFLLACIPIFWNSLLRWPLLACLAVIFLPLDLIFSHFDSLVPTYSFAGDEIIDLDWHLGAGTFIRPAVNFFLLLVSSLNLAMLAMRTPLRSRQQLPDLI